MSTTNRYLRYDPWCVAGTFKLTLCMYRLLSTFLPQAFARSQVQYGRHEYCQPAAGLPRCRRLPEKLHELNTFEQRHPDSSVLHEWLRSLKAQQFDREAARVA